MADAADFVEVRTKAARQIAKDHRQCPQHRAAIEAQIAADGRWAEFTHNRDGQLIARITAEDRQRQRGASTHIRKGDWIADWFTPDGFWLAAVTREGARVGA